MATFSGSNGVDTANATTGVLTGFTGGSVANLQDSIGDTFFLFDGNDTVVAGNGDDVIRFDLGGDTLRGGGGNDRFEIQGSGSFAPSSVIDGGSAAAQDEIRIVSAGTTELRNVTIASSGTTSIEKLSFVNGIINTTFFNTTQFNSTGMSTSLLIEGGDLANSVEFFMTTGSTFNMSGFTFNSWTDSNDTLTVRGSTGNDVIVGSSRRDTILGNDGSDTITGGAGSDTLRGGNDNDVFIYNAQSEISNDVIDGGSATTRDELRINFTGQADFQGASFSSSGTTSIEYVNMLGIGHNVIFNASQFGSGKLSNTLTIEGGGDFSLDVLTINMTSSGNFDASSFTFLFWLEVSDRTILNGSAGADTIIATAFTDTLAGGAGDDVLTGGAGNDTFVSGSGFDVVTDFVSGAAEDRLDVSSFGTLSDFSRVQGLTSQVGSDTIITFAYDNVVTLQGVTAASLVSSNYTLAAPGTGNPINGNVSGNTLSGTAGIDVIDGAGGNDVLHGLGGDDVLIGGSGIDYLFSGIGSNTLSGGADLDILVSEGTADILNGGADQNYYYRQAAGASQSFGGDGVDILVGGDANASDDLFYGFGGDDFALGGAGNDELIGGNGNDFLLGQDGSDILDGGSGIDYLFSGTGNNTLSGGAGLDILVSEGTADILNGGADQNYYYRQAAGASQSFGGDDVDILVGGDANASDDLFYGFGGEDFALGGAGNDELIGGNGNDILFGQDGSDILDGGLGTNYLYADGAAGSDTVRVNASLGGTQTQLLVSFEGGGTNDVLEISGSTLTSYAQFQTLAGNLGVASNGNLLQNTGVGALLTLGLGTANQTDIWFFGTLAGGLTNSDFTFV